MWDFVPQHSRCTWPCGVQLIRNDKSCGAEYLLYCSIILSSCNSRSFGGRPKPWLRNLHLLQPQKTTVETASLYRWKKELAQVRAWFRQQAQTVIERAIERTAMPHFGWNMAVHELRTGYGLTSTRLYRPAMLQPSVRSSGGTGGLVPSSPCGKFVQTLSFTVWKDCGRYIRVKEGTSVR